MQVGDGALVVQGSPCEGESFRGFALRIVEANRLSGLKALFTKAGKQFSLHFAVDQSLLQRVSHATGAPLEALERLGGVTTSQGFAKWGTLEIPLPKRYFGTNRCKVCPECVAETGYLQGIWEITMLAACPVHGCKLLYECPECRKPLTWTRRALLHCCKEAPFAAARTGPADERAVELARLFASKFQGGAPGPFPRVCERIGALTGEEVILLILLAGLRPEDGGSDKAIFRARSDGKYVETLVLRAADTLLDWPTGMSGFSAAWDAAKGPGATRGAVKDFGYLYHRLQTQLSGPAFAFFRDEVWEQKVARSPLSSLAHKRTKRMSTALSAKAVVKTYGVGKHWLEEWTACGTLELTTVKVGKVLRHQYDRKQIESLLQRLSPSPSNSPDGFVASRLPRPNTVNLKDGWISQSKAARQLGIRMQEIPELAREGLIDSLFQDGISNFDPASLRDLLNRIALLSSEPSKTFNTALLRGHFLRLNLRVETGGIIKRVQAVLEGRLLCNNLTNGKGLGRFAAPVEHLAALGSLVTFDRPWARMAEACAHIGCTPPIGRILIAHGYLKLMPSDVSKKSPLTQWHVLRSSLDTFNEKWVLGSALAGDRPLTGFLYRELARTYGPPVLSEKGAHLWPRHILPGNDKRKNRGLD